MLSSMPSPAISPDSQLINVGPGLWVIALMPISLDIYMQLIKLKDQNNDVKIKYQALL
jgi:hypothetical protein